MEVFDHIHVDSIQGSLLVRFAKWCEANGVMVRNTETFEK